jgi:hypothetical protein
VLDVEKRMARRTVTVMVMLFEGGWCVGFALLHSRRGFMCKAKPLERDTIER